MRNGVSPFVHLFQRQLTRRVRGVNRIDQRPETSWETKKIRSDIISGWVASIKFPRKHERIDKSELNSRIDQGSHYYVYTLRIKLTPESLNLARQPQRICLIYQSIRRARTASGGTADSLTTSFLILQQTGSCSIPF